MRQSQAMTRVVRASKRALQAACANKAVEVNQVQFTWKPLYEGVGMSVRWRFYVAEAMQSAGALWIVGWCLSHWVASLAPVFGPLGWLPAPIGLTLIGLGGRLLWYREVAVNRRFSRPPNAKTRRSRALAMPHVRAVQLKAVSAFIMKLPRRLQSPSSHE
jgi:hypothetical protein